MFKRFVSTAAAVVCAAALSTAAFAQTAKPKNIILFVGDGMGKTHVDLAALLQDGPMPGEDGKPPMLYFEEWPVLGSVATHATDAMITDSAASATSLASGVKTYNGAIGFTVDKQPVEEVITDLAKAKGMSTAVVSSVSANHATPASFYAHNESRQNYDDILEQFFTNPNVDVLLGGGLHGSLYIAGKAEDWAKEHGVTILSKEDLQKQDFSEYAGKRVFGQFDENSDRHLDYIASEDRGDEPRLEDLANAALEIMLAKEKPFFMSIESGAIDWASHANDEKMMLGEMYEFERTIRQVCERLEQAGELDETLLIVTADHECGGLTVPEPYGEVVTTFEEVQVSWSTGKHTMAAVGIWARGPMAEQVSGKIDQTHVFQAMKKALED